MSRVDAEERFAVVPEWVLFSELSAQAVRLYAVLARYADRDGKAFPSRRRLAADLGVRSVDTVDRALSELTRVGAVDVERTTDDAGDPGPNLYTIRVSRRGSRKDAATPPQEPGEGGRTDAARGSRTDAALRRAKGNENQGKEKRATPHARMMEAFVACMGRNPEGGEGSAWGKLAKEVVAARVEPEEFVARFDVARSTWRIAPTLRSVWRQWGDLRPGRVSGDALVAHLRSVK